MSIASMRPAAYTHLPPKNHNPITTTISSGVAINETIAVNICARALFRFDPPKTGSSCRYSSKSILSASRTLQPVTQGAGVPPKKYVRSENENNFYLLRLNLSLSNHEHSPAHKVGQK